MAKLIKGNAKNSSILGSAIIANGWTNKISNDDVKACHPVNGVPGAVPPDWTTFVAGRKNDALNISHARMTMTIGK